MIVEPLQPKQLEFLHQVQQVWQHQQFDRLILSQYQGELPQLQKIVVRPVLLKQQLHLSVLYRYQTKDVTKNYLWDEFEGLLKTWLSQCRQINLFTHEQEVQLKYKKGQWQLSQKQTKVPNTDKPKQQHNRDKKRWVEQECIFLQLLGITDQQHNVIPSMMRKWKQINKFVEIFSNTLAQIQLDQEQQLHVVDFGSGKGYLTCAVYDYLLGQNISPQVTGVELRQELVEFCQQVADQAQYSNLKFFQGDVRSYQPEHTDVMIALHACDIATDFAIHTGIRLGAKVIMCAPCCHKELRPQLQAPAILKPMLHFGVHAGQQAEMLTDTLRVMLLQAYGYDTKILEFVSLEHTSKNKMILATKQKRLQQPDQKILQQVQELKQFYAIQSQTLELLLQDLPVDRNMGCAC